MTTEIEKTKRALYGCLDRIRRAGKHRKLTAEFEERLEEHLEALRLSRVQFTESRHNDLERRLSAKIEECDQVQQRLQALEFANKAAGEELIRAQGVASQYLDDCRNAEKHRDRFSEQLREAQSVIANQEQLIVGQRLAIADLYLAGRRVNSAVATLQHLGYTDCGGQLWKPPIGKKPDFSSNEWRTPEVAGAFRCSGGSGGVNR